MRKYIRLLLAGLLLFAGKVSGQQGFWLPVDANGWTVITPAHDTKKIYVSSSEGNDAWDGLTPQTPKRTIGAANALIADVSSDWLLLKRGDVFPQPDLGRWKSGRSASEPLVMSYYGDSGPRPVIKLTGKLVDWNGDDRSHTAFIGLDLYRSISDPDSEDFNNAGSDFALRFVPHNSNNGATNVLVEDCLLRYCSPLAQNQGGTTSPARNVVLRRNVVTYNWTPGSTTDEGGAMTRMSGMYIQGVEGFVFEENLFHHNGHSLKVNGAGANQHSHNLYMSHSVGGTILVRGNIFSHGASHGIHFRSGGTAVMNAFVGNAIGLNFGYPDPPTRYTGPTDVSDNVVTDGRPMIPDKFTEPQTGAIWGITRGGSHLDPLGLTINGNIVANIKDDRGSNRSPYYPKTWDPNDHGAGNIGWNWVSTSIPETADPAWAYPGRNADGYAQLQGMSDWNSFIDAAANRPVGRMPFNLSAYAYANYIREGYDKTAVTPPYQYDANCSGIAVAGVSILPVSVQMTLPGETRGLQAVFLPSDACNRGLTWESDDPAIATVDASGLVTAVSPGTTAIRVTTAEGSRTDEVQVTITGFIQVTGVTLIPRSVSLQGGGSRQLTATVAPANATDPTITWSSSDESVATVSQGGLVVGTGSGSATITATAGCISDVCEVTVTGIGGYLLDAINNNYLPAATNDRQVGTKAALPGPGIRTYRTYQPGVRLPAAVTNTWPVCYGGYSFISQGRTSADHEMQYDSREGFKRLRFVNAQGGDINALVYWNLPDAVAFDGLNLSTRIQSTDAQGHANIHFVVKSGNDLYVSHAYADRPYLVANGFSFQLDVNSTDWQLWDFAANGGDNFVVSFAPPAGARRLSVQDIAGIEAIGLYISANTGSIRVNRDIEQIAYAATGLYTNPVTGVTVAPKNISLEARETHQLTATVAPVDATNGRSPGRQATKA